MAYTYSPTYPTVLRYPSAVDLLRPPSLGIDFEWELRDERSTIVGVSDGSTTVSLPHDEGWPGVRGLIDRFGGGDGEWEFIGHNFIRAERPLLRRLGVVVPLPKIFDTIIAHYLTSAHLCKAGGKAVGEEGEGGKRGPGFMNIWTMCSIHTSLACWKFCRGSEECEVGGAPCPDHRPFDYNGIDALGPVLAAPSLKRKMKLLGVDHLYPLHARLNEQFEIMKERGVWVDKAYVDELREKFIAAKGVLWGNEQEIPTANSLPFNPRSHEQVKKYFKDKHDIVIPDTQEATIRELAEEHQIKELDDLLEYKELGSGPDRWFAPKVWAGKDWEGYVVDQGGGLGTIHPNLNHFTSSSRTACSNPNMQNVEKRRIDRETGENVGKRMRRAIVAPPGYRLYSADFSNAENRVFMYLAGYLDVPPDLHEWMVANIGIRADDEFAISLGSPRDASKSVTHAADYFEGLQLLNPARLKSPRIRAEIAAGARIVFEDWKFRDSVVSFTGANLAARSLGDKSWPSRKKALGIAERYIGKNGAFPQVRDLQKKITKQIETAGAVKVPEGYYLLSYDKTQEDRLKTAAAMWGQSPIAHRLKISMLNLEAHPRLIPVLPVHDENLVYADVKYEPKDVKKWIQECMVFETPEMPGLRIPVDVKVGFNWKEMEKIK